MEFGSQGIGMRLSSGKSPKSFSPVSGGGGEVHVLPALATAEQIAGVLQVSSRLIHLWAASGKIPTALRCGKVVRFAPLEIFAALGIHLPEFGVTSEEATTDRDSTL